MKDTVREKAENKRSIRWMYSAAAYRAREGGGKGRGWVTAVEPEAWRGTLLVSSTADFLARARWWKWIWNDKDRQRKMCRHWDQSFNFPRWRLGFEMVGLNLFWYNNVVLCRFRVLVPCFPKKKKKRRNARSWMSCAAESGAWCQQGSSVSLTVFHFLHYVTFYCG